jgi:hypothetical protein
MLTIPFLVSIFINAIIGTLPVLGPLLSGILIGMIVRKKNLAMVVAFIGSIMGGVFCRIFLLYPDNEWHRYLLNILGSQVGQYAGIIIRGNIFFFALYFGLLGIMGGFTGALFINRIRKS